MLLRGIPFLTRSYLNDTPALFIVPDFFSNSFFLSSKEILLSLLGTGYLSMDFTVFESADDSLFAFALAAASRETYMFSFPFDLISSYCMFCLFPLVYSSSSKLIENTSLIDALSISFFRAM